MTGTNGRVRWRTACVLASIGVIGVIWATLLGLARASADTPEALETSFQQHAKPFLNQHCMQCHNENLALSGVRLDLLNGAFKDRHMRLWAVVQKKIVEETMPPEGAPKPTDTQRQEMIDWIEQALTLARSRPVPKNGLVRRLTVSQYRNTLRELLLLDDNLTETLPPDAVSEDGFVNNTSTLDLSPLLMESYFEIAEDALGRAIVDPDSKPAVQNFRVDLGRSINPEPLPEKLILGALSHLLENEDVLVTQTKPNKPFAFIPVQMRTKYRFIEGYKGNATVRGWREYDSIYHAVFACMRGSPGYPKGKAYSTVPEGLLLRPAIRSDEQFGIDSTYGPKANFKISLRELPDHGRFRVTVTAAKYNDGLLLDPGTPARAPYGSTSLTINHPKRSETVLIEHGGIYQVDLFEAPENEVSMEGESSRLDEELAGAWSFEGASSVHLEGDAHFLDSPFGQAVSLDGEYDSVVIPRSAGLEIGDGDFSVALWIRPKQLRNAGLVALGAYDGVKGWYLDMPSNKGDLRLGTTGPDTQSNGELVSPQGILRKGKWQHVAAVVKRGSSESRIYVNGYPVGKGFVGPKNLDNPELDLHLGHIPDAGFYLGELDEVRVYRRALGESEIQALVEPGRSLATRPPEKPPDVTLNLGGRQFAATLHQAAFLAVRLKAGEMQVGTQTSGVRDLMRIVLTPLANQDEVARDFLAFEKRVPRLGVHLGLRRDCGSTLAPVGPPQAVKGEALHRYVFEGAIRDFPSPDVEKDNVNYLAGIREIGVRSEYTDGRDLPRLLVRSVEFEGPLHETWPPESHKSVFVDFDRKVDSNAYAREILQRFGSRAYRRPITAEEASALMAVFQQSLIEGHSFRDSVKHALLVVLTSPQYLFLAESSSTPEPEPVDDHELASKLSYFLWNGPPDETALRLAENGQLRIRLGEEIGRMIADSRFYRFVEQFASQWLSLNKLDVLEPDRERFPKLTLHTRAQLRREPIEFLQYLFRENLPARNLVESEFIMANEVVASYYDLGDRTDSGFQFVPIHHGRPDLGGVLTQAAIMAGLSDGREANPVKRGAWLARKIIAEPPDDPPPNVPDLEVETEGLPLRERLELHRSQPGCVQCHTKIDPWGVPLQEIDAGGRLKGEPVDARSKLPDNTEVSGVNDLKRYLAGDRLDQVAFSVLKHLATYATGRSLSYGELDYLKQDGLKLRASGYGMQDMIRYVASSKLFLEK